MDFKSRILRRISAEELLTRGLATHSYDRNFGWKHDTLIELAAAYRIPLGRDFYKSERRDEGIQNLEENLKNHKPVIASVFFQFDKSKGGHLVVLNGYRANGNGIEGYHVQDPDPRFRGNNYFVSKEEFLDNWRGGLLWSKD